MKKKRLLFVLLAICILAGSLCGIWAFRMSKTLTVQTPITTNTLSIQMPRIQMDLSQKASLHMIPGDFVNASTHVLNDGDYEEYVRVKVEKEWIDDNGNAVADADASYIILRTSHASDWIVDSNTKQPGNAYYYFTRPITQNDITSNIIDSIEIGNIPSREQNKYNHLHIRLNLTAESVQRIDGQEAIRYEWNIPCTMDEQGQLLAVGHADTN